jgi:hypothetical protein
VVEAMEEAFLRHGAPKHIITDQECSLECDKNR